MSLISLNSLAVFRAPLNARQSDKKKREMKEVAVLECE